ENCACAKAVASGPWRDRISASGAGMAGITEKEERRRTIGGTRPCQDCVVWYQVLTFPALSSSCPTRNLNPTINPLRRPTTARACVHPWSGRTSSNAKRRSGGATLIPPATATGKGTGGASTSESLPDRGDLQRFQLKDSHNG